MKTKPKFFRIMSNSFFAMKKLFKIAPFYIVFEFLLMIISSIANFFTSTYLIKLIIDGLIEGKNFKEFINLFIITGLVIIFNKGLHILFSFFSMKINKKIDILNKEEIYKKSTKIQLETYYNPSFYSEFYFNINEVTNNFMGVYREFLGSISELVTFLLIFITLINVNIEIGLVVLVISILTVIFSNWKLSKATKLLFERSREVSSYDRRLRYTSRLLYVPDYAKEMKNEDLFNLTIDHYNETTNKSIECNKKYGKKMLLQHIILSFISDGVTFFILPAYLLVKAFISKTLNASTLWLTIKNASNLSQSGIFYMYFRLKSHSMYIDKYKEFINHEEEEIIEIDNPETVESIELNNVYFQYKNNENYTLKDISLKINKGEKIAFVGLNGGGKTTLLNLLLCLYKPTKGKMKINDKLEYNIQAYRNLCGPLFQDYNIYALSLKENTLFEKNYEDYENDFKKLSEQLEMEDITFGLPNSIDTILSKEFDNKGVKLSGGQEQKIALLRTLLVDSDLLILDEPTSRMDLESEKIIDNFLYSSDKTIILASHRLSIVSKLDRIYVIEEGEIIEEGSHLQLINKKGRYEEMFRLQSEIYSKQ